MKTEKRCSHCKTWKPIEEFRKDRSAKDGYSHECKVCARIRDAQYRGADIEKLNAKRERLAAINWSQIFAAYEQGQQIKEIAEGFGLSATAIRTRLVKKYGTSGQLSEFQRQCIDLFNQGLCSTEIAEALESDAGRVGNCLRSMGYRFSEEQMARAKELGIKKSIDGKREENESKAIEKIEAHGFRYLEGYTGSSCMVTVQCRQCGAVLQKSYDSIRHNQITRCPSCEKIKANERKAEREKAQQKRKADQEKRKLEKEAERQAKLEMVRICEECGAEYHSVRGQSKYCCATCAKRAANRIHSRKREKSRTKIPIGRLYKRDGGTCYICGCKCSFDDHQIVDGNFITGKTYPTVEHVIPLSAGGPDSWENVRLACHSCNTKKSTKSVVKVEESGQLAFA